MAKTTRKTPIKVTSTEQGDHQFITNFEARLAAMEQRSVAVAAGVPAQTVHYHPAPGTGCECNSKNCCCFDIYLTRVRIIDDQGNIEPADGGIVSQYMEMIFNVVAGEFSGIHPSLVAPMQISRKLGWVSVNKKISSISVKGTKSIPVVVEAREVGGTAELRPEFGTSHVSQLNIACGCPVVPIQIKVELNAGGRAGGVIEAEISAKEVCCDTC